MDFQWERSNYFLEFDNIKTMYLFSVAQTSFLG